jgi:hypothetical protein
MAATALQKHILDHVRLKAEEAVEAELFQNYGTDPDGIVSPIQKEGMVALKIALFMQEVRDMQNELSGEQGDPLVDLKKQELQQRADNDNKKIALDQQKLAIDQQKVAQNAQAQHNRVKSHENIAQLRANVARERMNATQFSKPPQGGRNAA